MADILTHSDTKILISDEKPIEIKHVIDGRYIDGVAIEPGDRFLFPNHPDPSLNGVYEMKRADYHADANPRPAQPAPYIGPGNRAQRRNAEREERNAKKRLRRKLEWKGVRAGDRPYTPTTKDEPDADL